MKINGTYLILEIEIGDSYVPICALESNSLEEDLGLIESTLGGWTTIRPANQGYNIPFNGFIESDDNGGTIVDYIALRDFKRGLTRINWRLTSQLGKSWIGKGYIDIISNSQGKERYNTCSANIMGWGKIESTNIDGITFDSTTILFDSTLIRWDNVSY